MSMPSQTWFGCPPDKLGELKQSITERTGNPDGGKIEIHHDEDCRCVIDGAAIYVVAPCYVVGRHVTKRVPTTRTWSRKDGAC